MGRSGSRSASSCRRSSPWPYVCSVSVALTARRRGPYNLASPTARSHSKESPHPSMNLFGTYRSGRERGGYQSAYDEMFADPAKLHPRSHYKALFDRLSSLRDDDFQRRVALADATLMNQGITFTVYGDAAGVE